MRGNRHMRVIGYCLIIFMHLILLYILMHMKALQMRSQVLNFMWAGIKDSCVVCHAMLPTPCNAFHSLPSSSIYKTANTIITALRYLIYLSIVKTLSLLVLLVPKTRTITRPKILFFHFLERSRRIMPGYLVFDAMAILVFWNWDSRHLVGPIQLVRVVLWLSVVVSILARKCPTIIPAK